MLLGTAAGKVGDLVFYRAGGEQRTRTKVTPANPKTYAQQAQRSRMANVTLMYRALSALLKDSFPTRPSQQTPFNAFAAAALPDAPYLTKDNADLGYFFLQPTLVAKGGISVPWREVLNSGETGNGAVLEFAPSTAPTTVGALSRFLVESRPCAFQQGGRVILVVLTNTQDENPSRHQARYYVIPIDVDSEVTLSSLGVTVTLTPAAEGLPAMTTLSVTPPGPTYGFAAVVEAPKSGGGYDVCDAYLILDVYNTNTYRGALTDEAAERAAISYGGTQGSCVVNS